ncbi:DUF222 domain-containing protein [Gordonia sp. VNK1]|uniref:HNH endonuclease signature motif containing protein n=1 Tax=Gordonia oleivorans TaxID=3156618 RepID=UPI0032B3BB79
MTDTTDSPMSRPLQLMHQLSEILDELAQTPMTACSDTEVIEAAKLSEQIATRTHFQGDRAILEISDRSVHRKVGKVSLSNFLNFDLRIAQPTMRIAHMKATARFHGLTGQPEEPKFPTLSKAYEQGLIGHTHLSAALEALDKIPGAVPHDKKVAAEETLGEKATEHIPADITKMGARILAHLDPDGQLVEEKERQQRRNLWINQSRVDGMAKLNGHLPPVTRALWDTMLDAWAKPGMNSLSDPESPTGAIGDADPDVLAAAVKRDDRSQAQRNLDAMHMLLVSAMKEGVLGKTHRGLPVALIAKASVTDLLAGAGYATTASGSTIPIPDLLSALGDIEDPTDVQQFLAVFSDAIDLPLYLGRSRRLASTEQRIASFSRTGGEVCSFPGCGQPASRSEMHHAKEDWADGGKTDISDLAPACGPHNRMVGPKPGQYTTGIYEDGPLAGRCWWQLNAEPGMPANPKIVNDHPDITALYEEKLDQIREQIHGDIVADCGAGATEPADTDAVDADTVDAETADIEADVADAEDEAESVHTDIDEPADPDDEDTASPFVDAEISSDRGVSSDYPAPAADSSSIDDSIDIADSVDQDADHESGVTDRPDPAVDEYGSGADQFDPVEPQPPDQQDRPGAIGDEHSDEPGVTDTGEIDLVVFDGDGVPITDDPDDPAAAAGMDRASRTRIRVRDTTSEGQPRERRIRDGGIRTSDADRERELEELAAIGMNPRNSRIERVLAARLHYRLDTS